MTWEELFLALQQVYQTDKELMKRKVSAVYSADEAVLLDLMVNTRGTAICFVPDYEDPDGQYEGNDYSVFRS